MAKKILIVDDNKEWVKMLVMRLESEGYEISAAFDALFAIRQIKVLKPHLVLLDIKMPAGSGINVLKNIRMNVETFNLPVIIATASANNEIKEAAEKLGISGYLLKPVDNNSLLQEIKKVFEEKSQDVSE
ncbi:MAG: response regulator [Candidatus Omnitrophica bacterium]|nr:response regulator [Candidatus Omnitrophota bacterium]